MVGHGAGDGDYGNNDIIEGGINDNNDDDKNDNIEGGNNDNNDCDKDDNIDKLLFVDVQAPGRRGGQWVGRLTRTPTPSQVS